MKKSGIEKKLSHVNQSAVQVRHLYISIPSSPYKGGTLYYRKPQSNFYFGISPILIALAGIGTFRFQNMNLTHSKEILEGKMCEFSGVSSLTKEAQPKCFI